MNIRGKKIIVTGASGFLGQYVTRLLKAEGANVHEPTHKNCDLVQPFMAETMLKIKKPDAVIHLAASIGGIGANVKIGGP